MGQHRRLRVRVHGRQDGLRLLQAGREQLAPSCPQHAVPDRAGGPGAPEPDRPAPDLLTAGAAGPQLEYALPGPGHPGRVQPDGRPHRRGHRPAGGAVLCDQPTVRYDSSEARARSRLVTGLWHQCHGALSQLFSGFTLPMQLVGENWQPPNLPEIGSIKALDAFIQPL